MKKSILVISVIVSMLMIGCSGHKVKNKNEEAGEMKTNREKAVELLESIETGAKEPVAYINPNKYIQHNLSVEDGLEGFKKAMQSLEKNGGGKVEVLRSFQDGDYVVTHSKYDFFGVKAGFDIFRFEDGLIVEHWDNLLKLMPPNESGRTQFDGETELKDLDKTGQNKKLVGDFYQTIIIEGQMQRMAEFFDGDKYIQHNPLLPDNVSGFLAAVKKMMEKDIKMNLDTLHIVLGQGNLVLTVGEGDFQGKPYAFYDLFRVENGKIAEHWDVMAEVIPKSEWKNNNGKFNFPK